MQKTTSPLKIIILGLVLVVLIVFSITIVKSVFSRFDFSPVSASGDGSVEGVTPLSPTPTLDTSSQDESLYWYRYQSSPTPVPDDPSLYWYRKGRKPIKTNTSNQDLHWYRQNTTASYQEPDQSGYWYRNPTAFPTSSPNNDLYWYRRPPTPTPSSALWCWYNNLTNHYPPCPRPTNIPHPTFTPIPSSTRTPTRRPTSTPFPTSTPTSTPLPTSTPTQVHVRISPVFPPPIHCQPIIQPAVIYIEHAVVYVPDDNIDKVFIIQQGDGLHNQSFETVFANNDNQSQLIKVATIALIKSEEGNRQEIIDSVNHALRSNDPGQINNLARHINESNNCGCSYSSF